MNKILVGVAGGIIAVAAVVGVTRAYFISSILLLSIPLSYLMMLVLASFDAVRKVEEKGMFSLTHMRKMD